MSEWQPIESAPRDGTEIQLWAKGEWFPNAHWCRSKLGWYEEYWDAHWCSYSESGIYNATHWMPLPTPPSFTSTPAEPMREA